MLKESGTSHWASPNLGATNGSGFTALPGGYRWYLNGNFVSFGSFGCWWSSTEYNLSTAWFRDLGSNAYEVGHTYFGKPDSDSVRCLRD
jgi:uncharacterized protein (TIGR02145 family)